jgi:hypothetical protein
MKHLELGLAGQEPVDLQGSEPERNEEPGTDITLKANRLQKGKR